MTERGVYERLREAIVTGRIMPRERLIEADLMERFSASRAAVRTAIVRLDHEGLVEQTRNRSAQVRWIHEREAVEIYEVRALLEGLAARRAAERATADDVAQLRALLARARERLAVHDLAGASQVNADLHAAVVSIADHATSSRLVDSLNAYLVRFQYQMILQPGRPDASIVEHERIVEAIAAGDADEAERAMREHLAELIATLEAAAEGDALER